MRVSDYYRLGRTQPSLGFVDVRIDTDTRLFLSPRAIRTLPSEWGDHCVSLVQSFFGNVLSCIKNRESEKAVQLLRFLRELNETHLGLSKGKSRGRALGARSVDDVWQALSKSEAAKSGLLTDLEDTVLMIEGISVDLVSDMLTNIIREPLISFTQEICQLYNIPMASEVDSGPIWDPLSEQWTNRFFSLPTPNNEKLLLVPKEIVRVDMDYDVEKYYRNYLLEHFKEEEIKVGSDLVGMLKSRKKKGEPKVFIKDLKKKYGEGKSAVVRHSLNNPSILKKYKDDNQKPSDPLPHQAFSDVSNTPRPDWNALLRQVLDCDPGPEDAVSYEKASEAFFTALFYPVLTNPRFQHEIHDGRKRIDISYTNMASRGFFFWLSRHYSSANIFLECKNYSRDLANKELDQIAGRFSPNRGRVGFIIGRSFHDKALFERRCRDTAGDNRGYVILLDDNDLSLLASDAESNLDYLDFPILRSKFNQLID